ncbi:MAG: transaldolase family protein [Planctomycetaceae bacterium]|nr:transaldolase family protein [Planctomycetaceae bacterium]
MENNVYLKWLAHETPTVWWNDSAILAEQEQAYGNGATGMTTNPVLVSGALSGDRDMWKEKTSGVDKTLTGDAKALALMHAVTGFYAQKTMPIFTMGGIGEGYVCAQVNPNFHGDTEYMVEQAKVLASWSQNIVVKLPATAAGIRAFEQCVALGMNVAASVSFTVPQVLAVAEARESGKKTAEKNGVKPGLSIAVIMVGRLDDYLRDVAKDSALSIPESDIIQAGTACIKRAYRIFQSKGYDTFLMPAGCRGAYHVTSLAGAKMIMSIGPSIQKALAKESKPFMPHSNEEVSQDVLDRLLTMKEFRRAYEPDGMALEEFVTYGATNRTLTQFIECGWKPIGAYGF